MNVEKYIGKSFRDKGRGPDDYDCYGLICAIYRDERGIELTNYLNYEDSTDALRIPLLYYKEREKWEEVELPMEYDIVVLDINGQPLHVGCMIDSKMFIHITKGTCVSAESIESQVWKNRIHGFYRHS